MAEVFRPVYYVTHPETGQRIKRRSKRWHVRYYTPDGRRLRVKGFTDRKATDALAVEGLEAALDRAAACREAGADMLFPEALTDLDQYRAFRARVDIPILANMTEFGKTPLFSREELGAAGVDLVLYPLTVNRAMNRAAENALAALRADGHQRALVDTMQTREELYEVLGYHAYEKKLDELVGRETEKPGGKE